MIDLWSIELALSKSSTLCDIRNDEIKPSEDLDCIVENNVIICSFDKFIGILLYFVSKVYKLLKINICSYSLTFRHKKSLF